MNLAVVCSVLGEIICLDIGTGTACKITGPEYHFHIYPVGSVRNKDVVHLEDNIK